MISLPIIALIALAVLAVAILIVMSDDNEERGEDENQFTDLIDDEG